MAAVDIKDNPSATDTVVLLQAGTLGGCLTLYRDRSTEMQRYQVNLTDRSASVLGDTGGSQHDSYTMSSVEDAFMCLDRYPWHQFTPHVIHPDMQSFVWAIINERFEQGLVTSFALSQWKRCCAATGGAVAPSSNGVANINLELQGPVTNVVNISPKLSVRNGKSQSARDDRHGGAPLSSPDVGWLDATHFHRAVECGLAEIDHDGSYRVVADPATNMFSRGRSDSGHPIPVIETPEHIIGLATMARLHLDFGWPKECLNGHPHESSFSIVASVFPKSSSVHIVCDVRKTVDELVRLVASVMVICRKMPLTSSQASDEDECSARRWLRIFQRDRPSLFWVIGPSGAGIVYQLSYRGVYIQLNKVLDAVSCLNYPGTRCAISGWQSVEPVALSPP